MPIRKLIFPGAWIFIGGLLFVAFAIAEPIFKGLWVRDEIGSDPITAVVGPIIGQKRHVSGRLNYILRINHLDKHLQIAVEQDGQKAVVANYNLERGWHGNIHPEFGGIRYRSRWRGNTLVIEKQATFRGDFGNRGADCEQNWVLSPGGDVLTITTTIHQYANSYWEMGRAVPNNFTTKEVFKRK